MKIAAPKRPGQGGFTIGRYGSIDIQSHIRSTQDQFAVKPVGITRPHLHIHHRTEPVRKLGRESPRIKVDGFEQLWIDQRCIAARTALHGKVVQDRYLDPVEVITVFIGATAAYQNIVTVGRRHRQHARGRLHHFGDIAVRTGSQVDLLGPDAAHGNGRLGRGPERRRTDDHLADGHHPLFQLHIHQCRRGSRHQERLCQDSGIAFGIHVQRIVSRRNPFDFITTVRAGLLPQRIVHNQHQRSRQGQSAVLILHLAPDDPRGNRTYRLRIARYRNRQQQHPVIFPQTHHNRFISQQN